MMKKNSMYSGFSLVEMAVVLVILGLMLAAFLSPLSAQLDARNYAENRKAMTEIKEALMGYLVINGHFPCPAISNNDGREDRTAGNCNARVGFLPWSALGLAKTDTWGHLYRYSVSNTFSTSTVPISLASAPDITIQTRDNTGALVNQSTANAVPLVVMSFGRNGYFGTTNEGTVVANTSAGNADELANSTANTVFISREVSDNTAAAGGEFDDVILWISQGQIVDRLVTVNRLP